MGSNNPLEPMDTSEKQGEPADNPLLLDFFGIEDRAHADSQEKIARGQVESMRLPAG